MGSGEQNKNILITYFSEVSAHLRFLKKQEWRAVNYTVLIHVAVITIIKQYFENLSCNEKWVFSLLVVIASLFLLWYLRDTLHSILKARQRERAIIERFPELRSEFEKILNIETPHDYFKKEFKVISASDAPIIIPIFFIILSSTVLAVCIIWDCSGCICF